MRKGKGYQRDVHKVNYKTYERRNSWAGGETVPINDILSDIDKKYDKRIEDAKRDYAYIAEKLPLEGEELRKFRTEHNLWEIQVSFKDKLEIIPLDEALKTIERFRQKDKGRATYTYQKRIVNKDNQKFVYNKGNSYGYFDTSVRIPSMKRSEATWKRFYELFPYYREHYNELNNRNGIKLKKVW